MRDLIDRSVAINAIEQHAYRHTYIDQIIDIVNALPSAELDSCYGCKHIGQWENEVEYGYPSPCTRCKRRASDNYELRS